jgi:hypothetical protein
MYNKYGTLLSLLYGIPLSLYNVIAILQYFSLLF